ncbi:MULTISPECIES: VasL domain-containing protein [Serratia]|uniref:VasL domain-containing protein n=1 Tax=Serratia TaxID=613 RepID=UPI000EFC7B7B|nr:hypothetical protein EBA31_16710 [Serratia sp. P2ACOL2]
MTSSMWPDRPEVAEMNKQWQQRVAAYGLSDRSLTGWHDGMQQLQGLADRLNSLDGQKGKYITVSELKSSVYEMMNNFRNTVPLEEQLRVLQTQQGNAALATQQQIQRHFSGLQLRYSSLEQP